MPLNRNLICCILFLIAGAILSFYFYSRPIHDYGNYYYGSRFAVEGKNVNDIYEPYKFNLAVRELPGMQHEKFLLNYAVVPPPSLYLYVPFTFCEVHFSKFLFNIFSLVVFCFFLYGLLKLLNITSGYIILLPLLLIIPFSYNLLFGQSYLLLTGLMMGGFIAESKNKNALSGLYYSIAIILKISPAILLIYLLTRKKIKLCLTTTVISIVLFLAAIPITGIPLMQEYLFEFIPRMMQNEINNPYAGNYQSVTVMLRTLFVPDPLLNPDSMFNAPIIFSIGNGIFTGIIFFLLVMKIKIVLDDFSAFAFTLLGSLLLTAYTSSYSLIFLIPFALYVFRTKSKACPILLILIFVIASIPAGLFQSLPVILRFPRLYLLIVLFMIAAAEYKLIRIHFKWLFISVLVFVTASITMLKKTRDNSAYFLTHDAGLLSYGLRVSENKLFLKTLYEEGSREIVIADSVRSIRHLKIIDGQIYDVGRLTNGPDRKLSPLLINNSQVIYLSDKNRGIGFYTPRKIEF